MSKIKWRFPGNNFTGETGLDTSDMEMFKKDPIASLARELCQNSIDARYDKEKPVKVVFKSFELKRKQLPNVERLQQEIDSCKEYRSENTKIRKQLERMQQAIFLDTIKCLRVSDFNTQGLLGVDGDDKSPWYLLTKGSGISNKEGPSAGSKGIGKFATFVTSSFHTVFYSTQTKDGESAYQGICKLCSTKMEGTEEKTQGVGYYGQDKRNKPVLEYRSLDPEFTRKKNEYGTDVFVLGFQNEDNWVKEVVTKILESFMAAIIFGELIIEVDDIVISKSTIKEIVNSEDLILSKEKKSIKSQYILLTDETVHRTTLDIDNYGEVELYIKGFSRYEENNATNRYVIIRSPFMKIKDFKIGISIPCSAMCIIRDNELNMLLRDCENPQHTDWYLANISDPSLRKEVKHIIKELKNQISDTIREFLSSGDSEQTDIEGAEDYLPDTGEGNSDVQTKVFGETTPRVRKPVKNIPVHDKGLFDDDRATGRQPDVGSVDEDGDDADKPSGENENHGGGPKPSNEPGGYKDGDSDVLRRVKLSDVKYRFIVLDRKASKYKLTFTSPYEEENVELKLSYVDDAGSKNKVEIIEAKAENEELIVNDQGNIEVKLEKNKKYNFIVRTTLSEIFSSEVTLYAHRE